MRTRSISVIIPCFNQGHFLPDAMESIFAQGYEHWECLIINNGSKDNTEQVALGYVAKDRRIRYINHPKPGVSGARNRGLDEARGDFVQFLDADDIITPTKWHDQLNAMPAGDGLAVAYCDYYRARANDLHRPVLEHHMDPQFRSSDRLKEIIMRWESKMSIPIHCFLFDSRLFKQHGVRFDESLRNHVDWDCWISILTFRPELSYVDKKMAVYRLNSDSICTNQVAMREGFLRAIDKQRVRFASNPELIKALEQKRREVLWAYRKYAPVPRPVRLLRQTLKAVLPTSVRERLKKLEEKQSLGSG